MVVLLEDKEAFLKGYPDGIEGWKFIDRDPSSTNEIKIASVESNKGLEACMVIYIYGQESTDNMNYIAYTRAKYY